MGLTRPERAKKCPLRREKKEKKAFRFHRATAALTWSCPKGSDVTPIKSCQHVYDEVVERHGPPLQFTVGEEKHPTRPEASHFHAFFKWDHELDSEDRTLFDVAGVSPQIYPGKASSGFARYCAKEGIYITNHYQTDPFDQAASASTVPEGLEILWKKRPREMLLYADRIEANLSKRLCPAPTAPLYYGPWPSWFYPPHWDPNTHALLLVGDAGVGKTQFARYLMAHAYPSYSYFKGKHESGKKVRVDRPFIYDEVYLLEEDPNLSREITDVENGGTVGCRNSNYIIPPGVPRIFLSNCEHPFRNPGNAVYDRRVVSFAVNIPP